MKTLFISISILLLLSGFSVSHANELYGVTSPGELDGDVQQIGSSLYKIDPATGEAVEIGLTGFDRCLGLDFEPGTNDLFAICRNVEERNGGIEEIGRDEEEAEVLAKLNIDTGEAQEIGPLLIENRNRSTIVTDMSFDSSGVLYVYVINVGSPNNQLGIDNEDSRFFNDDRLGVVNLQTGKYTEIGPTGFDELASGIAFSRFNDLYHAGAQEINLLNILNRQTGGASPKAQLLLPPEIAEKFNILSSMDLHISTNRLFAVIVGQEQNGGAPSALARNDDELTSYLTSLNPSNGDLSIIGPTVSELAAIAFLNRDRTQIPTLSEWGLIALSGVFMLLAVYYLRRRVQA